MATSSIGHDIQITDKKEAEELVEAMEKAEKKLVDKERRLEVVSEKKKRKIEINLSEWESVILSGKGTVEFK
jgi:predicted neutral ceramidase superfamily lipid hydrolase